MEISLIPQQCFSFFNSLYSSGKAKSRFQEMLHIFKTDHYEIKDIVTINA